MHRLTATDTPMVRYTRTIFPSYANQGHKSMVEYSQGMICIGLLVVCFLIYYFTKYTFQFGFWFFDVYNLVYAKNDKKKIGIGIIVGVVLYALIMLLCG